MNRISCEICGSSDLIKQDGVFVCQACGCKYSAEEIKKQMVEITNPVQVVGVDNADTLYDRALEWLNLNNTAKAIEVLTEMTEKYPGDKRGWLKLTKLLPDRVDIRDVALKFKDGGLTAIHSEKEKYAQIEVDKIRSGKGNIPFDKVFAVGGRGYGKNNFIHVQSDYDYPCFRDLLSEAWENAKYFETAIREVYNYIQTDSQNLYRELRTLPGRMTLVAENADHQFITDLNKSWLLQNELKVRNDYNNNQYDYCFIAGNYVFIHSIHGPSDYETQVVGIYKAEQTFTQTALEQIINTYHNRRMKSLCPRCGNQLAKQFLSERTRCSNCKLNATWKQSDK